MIKNRIHIYLLTTIWLISVVGLDVIIPLHFFVKEHKSTSCNAEDKDSCSDQKSLDCDICAFDLFIGYPQTFNFAIKRTDILLYSIVIVSIKKLIFKTPLYTQLRAPPAISKLL